MSTDKYRLDLRQKNADTCCEAAFWKIIFYIKIDRSFTASAVADEGEYYLLNQFCSMIHNLNLKLCIEGVENKEEWSKIRNLQPDFSQGFFWGRPCPYEEFVEKFVEK